MHFTCNYVNYITIGRSLNQRLTTGLEILPQKMGDFAHAFEKKKEKKKYAYIPLFKFKMDISAQSL